MASGCEHNTRFESSGHLVCPDCNLAFPLTALAELGGSERTPDQVWKDMQEAMDQIAVDLQRDDLCDHLKKYFVRVGDHVAYVGFFKWKVDMFAGAKKKAGK